MECLDSIELLPSYQRRSPKLLAYIEKCLLFFHLEPYLRGLPCKMDEITLDDMITFRIS